MRRQVLAVGMNVVIMVRMGMRLLLVQGSSSHHVRGRNWWRKASVRMMNMMKGVVNMVMGTYDGGRW